MQRTWLYCTCLLPLLLMTSWSSAQNNYIAYELVRGNDFEPLMIEDLNGDGARDLIVSEYQPGLGRELLVYHQQADGNFASVPQRIEIKTEIIAVGFADLRADPGKELVLIANNGVFSLSTSIDGYAGNIKQLIEWESIAAIPNLERLQFIENIDDIDGDGQIDLLLPGIDGYGFFKGRGDEEFELISLIQTINQATTIAQRSATDDEIDGTIGINAEEGLVIEISAGQPSPFEDFVEQWDAEETEQRSLLNTENWMPGAILAQLNADEFGDLAYINVGDDGLGQLNVHFQDPQSGFNETPDWISSADTNGQLRFVDMNNDGLADLLRLSGDGNDWSARFFVNKNGRFDLEQASQIMRFSGFDVRLDFIDAFSNNNSVLSVSYYTIPVVDAIRNASINRTQLFYGNDAVEDAQLFNRRPASRLEESFSATNVRSLSGQMSVDYDVDGDGNKDALYITENGTLAAKTIDSSLTISEQPFWEYVSGKSVFQFEVLNLNSDDKPDILLIHGTSTTLLVASP